MPRVGASFAEYEALLPAIRGHRDALDVICRPLITGKKRPLRRADEPRVVRHFEAVTDCGIDVLSVQESRIFYDLRTSPDEKRRSHDLGDA